MESYLTVNDIYLLLRPLEINIYMVFAALFSLVALIVIYPTYKNRISKLNYILIGCLIVFNSIFLSLMLRGLPLEASRFFGMQKKDTTIELDSYEFQSFYKILDKTIRPGEKFYFHDPTDPFFINVRTKFRLAYFLAPRKLAKTIDEADYIIVANALHNRNIKVLMPINKTASVYKHSNRLLLVTLKPKKGKANE